MKRNHIDKVELAIASTRYITKESMATRFDWKDEMEKIVDRIESWRGR